MRVSRDEMARNHRRIVEGAARLLRERGIEGTSVADVMSDAGLTHGGFYRHFETKEALVTAALTAAFAEFLVALDWHARGENPEAGVEAYRNRYLSAGHVGHPGVGCPIAALACDVAREPEGLKRQFGAGVERVIAALADGMAGTDQERRAAAAREIAMLAGAVMIARASDPATAGRVLSACRRGA